MTVTAPRQAVRADEKVEALFKEARQKRQRRYTARCAAAVVAFGIVISWAATKNGGHANRVPHIRVTTEPSKSIAASLPSCDAKSLLATIGAGEGGSVQELGSTVLTLTNLSASACEIKTFPVIRLVGSTGVTATAQPPGQIHVGLEMQPGPSGAKVANVYWQNWCGTDPRPLTLQVILANGRGVVSSPYGSTSSPLPACTNSSQPTSFFPTGGLDTGSLFGTGH